MRRRFSAPWLGGLFACPRGVSAIEFALFAPFLCLGFLAMVDVGLAFGLRMELDRNVRSGAQAAITLDNPESAIAAVVRVSAGDPDDLEVAVDMTCFCREAGVLEPIEECSEPCDSGGDSTVFFAIRAERPYSGPIFGERTIASATRVQVR